MTEIDAMNYDIWTSSFTNVEFGDDTERAILTIPLMHEGPNKKGLFWTSKILKEITTLFQNVTFRYDLDGKEGSSHTIDKLSSPHFDIGWTYSGSEGAWFDSKTKTLWVKGEVTNPQVVEKLKRSTSDGKKEVNFASMGIIVDEAKCSICGSIYGECEHERNQVYDGKKCYKVPIKCSKGLHVALTNDPADGEAEIKDCIFQELTERKAIKSRSVYDSRNPTSSEDQVTPNYDMNKIRGKEMEQQPQQSPMNPPQQNQMQPGMAPAAPANFHPGPVFSPEELLRDLAERIRTIEQKMSVRGDNTGQLISGETPELVNSSPQDQMTQDNMGTTTQFKAQKSSEVKNMNSKDGQYSNEKTSVNPEKSEVQEIGAVTVDPMTQIMELLNQILAKLGNGAETQDVNELINADIGKAKKANENIALEHMAPGDAVKGGESESNQKNKEHMNEPGKVATADMKKEMADMKDELKNLKSRLEIQDSNIPEFGGSNQVEVADNASGRADRYGDFGKWDSIFNGEQSALKFKK